MMQETAGRKSVTVTAGTRTDSKFTDIGTSWAADISISSQTAEL